MGNCKNCISEKVCRYNDGHNLYCKEDYVCPHYSTADVREVKRGEWIKRYLDLLETVTCPFCLNEITPPDIAFRFDTYPNFCPNCGADMRKESE